MDRSMVFFSPHTPTKKRRMSDQVNDNCQPPDVEDYTGCGHQFLRIPRSEHVYQTEECRALDTALFHPVTEDLLVNVRNVEQISCSEGHYFVADLSGSYSHTITGKVIHLWRYDKTQRSLYISRSFLFTAAQEYLAVQQFLRSM